jgi:hypothetical protein
MHGLDWMLPAEMLPRSFVRIISPTRLIPVLLLPTLMTFVSDGFGRALLIATSVVHTFCHLSGALVPAPARHNIPTMHVSGIFIHLSPAATFTGAQFLFCTRFSTSSFSLKSELSASPHVIGLASNAQVLPNFYMKSE